MATVCGLDSRYPPGPHVLLSSHHLAGPFFQDFYLLLWNQQLKDRVHFPFYWCVLLKQEKRYLGRTIELLCQNIKNSTFTFLL